MSAGLSDADVRLVPMGTTARIILGEQSLAVIAEALEYAGEQAEDHRDGNEMFLLAEIIRGTVPEGVTMDLPLWDDERDERDQRTVAILAALLPEGEQS